MAAIKLHSKILLPSILIVLSILFILIGELPDDNLLLRELQNTGHTVLFAVIAVSMLNVLRGSSAITNKTHIQAYSIAAFSSFAIGVLIEAGQFLTQREPSILDIARNIAGILAGLGIFAAIDSDLKTLWCNEHRWVKNGIVALSFGLIAVSMVPIGYLVSAYIQRDDAFPIIIDFQAGWPRPFMQLQQATLAQVAAPEPLLSGGGHRDQQQVSQLILNRGRYPGISIIEPYPDWSAFTLLTLELYSPQTQAVDLVLRIHDRQHNQNYSDRFNLVLRVTPGRNRFHIPLINVEQAPTGRILDMRHIANITLFAVDIENPVELYPGRFILERCDSMPCS